MSTITTSPPIDEKFAQALHHIQARQAQQTKDYKGDWSAWSAISRSVRSLLWTSEPQVSQSTKDLVTQLEPLAKEWKLCEAEFQSAQNEATLSSFEAAAYTFISTLPAQSAVAVIWGKRVVCSKNEEDSTARDLREVTHRIVSAILAYTAQEVKPGYLTSSKYEEKALPHICQVIEQALANLANLDLRLPEQAQTKNEALPDLNEDSFGPFVSAEPSPSRPRTPDSLPDLTPQSPKALAVPHNSPAATHLAQIVPPNSPTPMRLDAQTSTDPEKKSIKLGMWGRRKANKAAKAEAAKTESAKVDS